jgi:hypothetical protein
MNQDDEIDEDNYLEPETNNIELGEGLVDASPNRRISIKDKHSEGESLLSNRVAPAVRSKLPILPFAVLLPNLGNLSILTSLHTSIKSRREFLKETASDSERESDRQYEEIMLNQIIQWLEQSKS